MLIGSIAMWHPCQSGRAAERREPPCCLPGPSPARMAVSKTLREAWPRALEEHSFRHLLPTFLIAPGTQVVLQADKPLPDGTVRQRGSVAVVAESPADNEHAYTLRFAD